MTRAELTVNKSFKLLGFLTRSLYRFAIWLISIVLIFPILVTAFISRVKRERRRGLQRFLFGSEPLINYIYWSRALTSHGYSSSTIVSYVYRISKNRDFDKVLNPHISSEYAGSKLRARLLGATSDIRTVYNFILSLFNNDIFVFSCQGFLLSEINSGAFSYKFERLVLRAASIKCIVIPYGADAYVYRRINDVGTLHALQLSYPQGARQQRSVAKRVDFWVDKADFFLPSGMSLEGFGRWDSVSPNLLAIDFDSLPTKARRNDEKICITHSPNHRGAKGTQHIIEACERLISEGNNIELLLLEGMQNSELLETIARRSSIHVDQILINGYGMNAIEAMGIGVPVIGHISGEFKEFFTTFSHLSECPIITASASTIYEVLAGLIKDASEQERRGTQGREYVSKYHTYSSFISTLKDLEIFS